jgi:signal transduction histidine kinase
MATPGFLRRFSGRLVPARASTQTWMILTFVFFVGIAVITVTAYVLFVLRAEIGQALNKTLVEQAQRIVFQVDRAATSEVRGQVVSNIARYADMRITVAFQDSVLWDAEGAKFAVGRLLSFEPEMKTSYINENEIVLHPNSLGEPVYYVTTHLPETGFVIRVGQRTPPLLNLVNRMKTTLVVGMIMALFLALLGSWIASQRVVSPLQRIRNSARNISEGDLDQEIVVDSRATEFIDLAESLNRMSDGFRDKIDELERMARVQNEFIGNVSHEVRNPIFAVGGYLEALATSSLPEEQRKHYARKAITNLQRLNTLFNDLIEIAQLEYREDLIHPEEFNMTELVDDVAEILRAKAAEKQLTLVASNPVFFVRADRNRIRQVVINLIENAINYSDEGTITSTLTSENGKVSIAVQDTGKGIAPEHLERVFERFYRIDPDRSRKSGGTGLGLSIVKQIVQAHGEHIFVESELGVGTRVWFELPAAELPVTEAA